MSSFMKILISVVVTIVVIGGGVYSFMNKQATDDKAGLQSQIDSLNKQVTDLKTTGTTIPVTTDETASWKTFTNSTNRYSIKYPASWVYDAAENNDSITFRTGEGEHWQFEIETTATTKTLKQNVDNELVIKRSGGYSTVASDETIAGQPASKVTISGLESPTIIEHLVVNNGKLFIVSLTDNSDSDLINMLSSFQFTN